MDSLFPYQCRLQLHFATKMFLSSFYFMAHESGNPFFFFNSRIQEFANLPAYD